MLLSRYVNFISFRKSVFNVFRRYSNRNILRLKERGMYEDVFPRENNHEIVDILNSGPQCVYAGFDPTSDSLHIGNLLVIINLLHWQRAGHNAIVLIGGATSRIGDPSGKTTDRPEIKSDIIERNSKSITEDVMRIFENHEKYFWDDTDKLKTIRIINNQQWYSSLSALDFVGNIGRHFRMGAMLSRNSVESRLSSEAGMSFNEFCYQIFQSYDWLQLWKMFNCRFQIGGSDQMGNIFSGHNFISRVTNMTVYGFTLPLITSETGDKFGKSAGNCIWLNSKKCSYFDFYQFFMRTKDSDVERLLNLFTFEKTGKIKDIMAQHKAYPETRIAQTKLAEQVTLLVHGETGLESALKTTKALYSNKIEDLARLSHEELCTLFCNSPNCELMLRPGITSLELALAAKCFLTEADARRIMSAGGFYINNQRVTNFEEVLTTAVHILPNNISLLRVGKRNHYLVKWIT